MSDKDLLVVISEMLRKQDQHAEKLDEHTKLIQQTNERLQVLTELSIQEFEWQHKQAEIQQGVNDRQDSFNQKFLAALDEQAIFNSDQRSYNQQFLTALNRQDTFNERFLAKLDEISNKL